MPNRMFFLVPAILVILLATLAFAASSSRAEPAGSDCLAAPNSRSGEGEHWYYRIDRATKRRCWYLGAAGAKVHKAEFTKRRSALRSTAKRTAACAGRLALRVCNMYRRPSSTVNSVSCISP